MTLPNPRRHGHFQTAQGLLMHMGSHHIVNDGVPQYVAYFRLLAFKLAWDVSYRDVNDGMERFGKALVASCAPIRDHDLARAIWRWSKGRAIRVAIEKGWPVPDIAKPFVRQYMKAMQGVTQLENESCVLE